MDAQLVLAFQFAKDLATQFITVAGIVAGITIAFAKDFNSNSSALKFTLVLSWILLLLSIFFGFADISALTGQLAPLDRVDAPREIAANVRSFAEWQVISFGLGMFFLMFYGICALWGKQTITH